MRGILLRPSPTRPLLAPVEYLRATIPDGNNELECVFQESAF